MYLIFQIKGGGLENEELRADLIKFLKLYSKRLTENLKVKAVQSFGEDYVNSMLLS